MVKVEEVGGTEISKESWRVITVGVNGAIVVGG